MEIGHLLKLFFKIL